ncbi:MAG: nucleotidyltransferase substrate binding protein [Candidatus Njordarchaeota archaeon]
MAYRMGWIKDEERWLELLEAINLTSHTYNQETAMDVYETVKENYEVFNSLLNELRKEI